jgi:hypothetical protein
MPTVKAVIKSAFKLAGIVAESETLTAEQESDGVTQFNDMLHAWKNQGIPLEHVTLTVSDVVPYPDDHIEPIKYNLAVKLAAEYDAPIDQLKIILAAQGLEGLRDYYSQPGLLSVDAALSPYYNSNRRFS